MRKFVLASALLLAALSPAAAYGPSGNLTMSKLELGFALMMRACKKMANPWQKDDCYRVVHMLRNTTSTDRLLREPDPNEPIFTNLRRLMSY